MVLKGADGVEKDYRHFGMPLILAVDDLFGRIRNLTYRYMPRASLFPIEVSQYDTWVLRETIHNCIAHQDYTKAGRINVLEEPERLLFTNLGDFLPGSVEEVIRRDQPPEHYRNACLTRAMVNFGMIDTIEVAFGRCSQLNVSGTFQCLTTNFTSRDVCGFD